MSQRGGGAGELKSNEFEKVIYAKAKKRPITRTAPLTPQDLFRGPAAGAVQAAAAWRWEHSGAAACAVRGRTARQHRRQPIHRRVARITQARRTWAAALCRPSTAPAADPRVGAQGGASGARVRLNDPAHLRPGQWCWRQSRAAAGPALQPRPGQLAGACPHRFSGLRRARCGDALCPAGNRPADPMRAATPAAPSRPKLLAPALPGCDPAPAGALAAWATTWPMSVMLVPDPAGGWWSPRTGWRPRSASTPRPAPNRCTCSSVALDGHRRPAV